MAIHLEKKIGEKHGDRASNRGRRVSEKGLEGRRRERKREINR